MSRRAFGDPVSRRRVIAGGLAAGLLGRVGVTARPAMAGDDGERHGLSFFGDLKYPSDFTHFDYVNPDAPKLGRLETSPYSWAYNQNPNTFDSLNTLILKGRGAVGLTRIFDSLMVRADDEPDAVYGLIARSVRVLDGGKRFVFRLRPEARFHDGSPLTAEDVAFSLMLLKDKGHPQISESVRGMLAAIADAPDTVTVTFADGASRGLPLFVAALPIVSKAYYTSHDFEQTTLDPPLGSGAYKVGRFEAGRYIEYARVDDYWAKDLPVMRGRNNFDIIRYEMYRDRTVAFEAFKSGQFLLHEEVSSLTWATKYDFPAARDNRVVRFEIPDGSPSGAQGWFLNTRRPQFKDVRVREALGLAFDFEWSNKNLFFGSYIRTASYFENSELKASGLPGPGELALLEPFRDRLPLEVFGEPWVPPVSDGSGRDRALLRRASELLAAAGWKPKDGKLRNERGEAFTLEFLDNSPALERAIGPFIQNLKLIGIDATFRVVDASQYQSRLETFDFDTISSRFTLPATPDESVRSYFHSDLATVNGSENYPGIADPVVDALIARILSAPTRPDLVAATRALDRVLRAGRYWIPHWYKAAHRIAMWDVYARPATVPAYDRGIETTWWVDRAKAEALGKGI